GAAGRGRAVRHIADADLEHVLEVARAGVAADGVEGAGALGDLGARRERAGVAAGLDPGVGGLRAGGGAGGAGPAEGAAGRRALGRGRQAAGQIRGAAGALGLAVGRAAGDVGAGPGAALAGAGSLGDRRDAGPVDEA